jgi:hypothetical protein
MADDICTAYTITTVADDSSHALSTSMADIGQSIADFRQSMAFTPSTRLMAMLSVDGLVSGLTGDAVCDGGGVCDRQSVRGEREREKDVRGEREREKDVRGDYVDLFDMRVRREVCDEEDLTGEEGVSDNLSNCGGLRNEKEMWIIEEDLKKAESALQIGDKPMYDPSYINELNFHLTKVAGNILKNVLPKEGLSKVDKLMMLNKMIDCESNQDTHFKIDFAREHLQSNSKQSRDTIDALRWSISNTNDRYMSLSLLMSRGIPRTLRNAASVLENKAESKKTEKSMLITTLTNLIDNEKQWECKIKAILLSTGSEKDKDITFKDVRQLINTQIQRRNKIRSISEFLKARKRDHTMKVISLKQSRLTS